MKLKLSLWLCICSFVSLAQSRSIQFETLSFKDALAKAKKENKLIFMDAYTTWCGPCKWMSKNMFTKDEVADYYNSNFINTKFDMEDGEGIQLAKQYEVRCYPNLLFIDGDGNLVHRTAGAMPEVANYISLGQKAQDPEKRFGRMQEDYAQKKNDPLFLAQYIEALGSTCLPVDEQISSYFALQTEESLISPLNWKMLFNYMNNYETREFKYLLSNQNKFAEIYGTDSVLLKISNVFQESGNSILYNKQFKENDYTEYVNKIKALNFNGRDAVLFHLELTYLDKKGDMKAMFAYAAEHGEEHFSLNELNNICWSIYEKSDEPSVLLKAESWMKRLTESENGSIYMNMDTYAAILYKLKKKKLAQEKAELAINLAIQEGMSESDYLPTKDLLAKIKKLK